jgi:hypothetical protein
VNRIQEAIARVSGVQGELEYLESALNDTGSALEAVSNDNRLLSRQIEDLDYLNLFDFGKVGEIIPSANREEYIKRLRRLRQENPLAKQSAKLTLRFTLGKGIQYLVAAEKVDAPVDPNNPNDPNAEPVDPNAPEDPANPSDPANPIPPKAAPTAQKPPFPAKEAVVPPPTASKPPVAPKKPVPPPEDPNQAPSGDQPVTDPKSNVVPPAEDGDPLKETMEMFWEHPDNELVLTTRRAMYEWVDGVYTDGEFFFIGVEGTAAPWLVLTEIPIEEIKLTIYDPDNRKKPIYYKRVYMELVYDGNTDQVVPAKNEPTTKYYLDYRVTEEDLARIGTRIKIPPAKLAKPEEKIKHSLINPLWTRIGQRGISELYSSRQWFRVFREFMENRAAINDAATAIAFKRKVKAGPTGVASFKGSLGGLETGYSNPANEGSEFRKATRPAPGATYDSNQAIDLEWMKTDTGAANAREDARMLLAVAGAGVGTMIHYYGEGGDANLATAQSMELPMVKSYEDWQQWLKDEIEDLLRWMLRLAFPDEYRDYLRRVSIVCPAIISQDVVKYITAYGQLTQNIAPDNKLVKIEAIRGALTVLGVANLNALMPMIEEEINTEEKKNPIPPQLIPFAGNMPPPPPNSNGPGNPDGPNPIQDGNGNVIPPDLQRIIAGKVPPSRNGIGGRIPSR